MKPITQSESINLLRETVFLLMQDAINESTHRRATKALEATTTIVEDPAQPIRTPLPDHAIAYLNSPEGKAMIAKAAVAVVKSERALTADRLNVVIGVDGSGINAEEAKWITEQSIRAIDAQKVRDDALEEAKLACNSLLSSDDDWDSSAWNQSVERCILKIESLKSSTAKNAAVKTLKNLGYTYHGAELWKPPIRKTLAQEDPSENEISEIAVGYGAIYSVNSQNPESPEFYFYAKDFYRLFRDLYTGARVPS